MNIEYMKLSDNEVIVSDENGILTKRKFKDESNFEEMLINENKLEKVNNELKKLEERLKQNKENIIFSKKIRKVILLILPFFIAFSCLVGGLLNINNFVEGALSWLSTGITIGIILSGASMIFNTLLLKETEEKIQGITGEITEGEKLKKEYEKEIERQKENISNLKKLENNESVSLAFENGIVFEDIKLDLQSAYNKAIMDKPKTRSLIRKK